MSKPVGEFINTQEYWELNHFLKKYGFRETETNRDNLVILIQNTIKPNLGLNSSDNLRWEQLHDYYSKNKNKFSILEKNNVD